MEEREYSNVYAIPANYTDSGKLLGGMLEVRNTIEAGLLVALVGCPELMWLHTSGAMKIVVMTVTLLPLGVAALMGIAGDSLLQYFGHIVRYWTSRRKLHFKRIGYRYESANTKRPPQKGLPKRPPEKRKETPRRVRSGFHPHKRD